MVNNRTIICVCNNDNNEEMNTKDEIIKNKGFKYASIHSYNKLRMQSNIMQIIKVAVRGNVSHLRYITF